MKSLSKIRGFELTADKIVGKELLLVRPTKAYRVPGGDIEGTLPAGSIIVPYAWVGDGSAERPLYWQMDWADGGSYYVKHNRNYIDTNHLMAQFSPEDQALYFPAPDLPNWIGLAALGVGLFKASTAKNADERWLWRLVAVGGGVFYGREVIGEALDSIRNFNPFNKG